MVYILTLNELKVLQEIFLNLNKFWTQSLNLKENKFKPNINIGGLNIATYGQA